MRNKTGRSTKTTPTPKALRQRKATGFGNMVAAFDGACTVSATDTRQSIPDQGHFYNSVMSADSMTFSLCYGDTEDHDDAYALAQRARLWVAASDGFKPMDFDTVYVANGMSCAALKLQSILPDYYDEPYVRLGTELKFLVFAPEEEPDFPTATITASATDGRAFDPKSYCSG